MKHLAKVLHNQQNSVKKSSPTHAIQLRPHQHLHSSLSHKNSSFSPHQSTRRLASYQCPLKTCINNTKTVYKFPHPLIIIGFNPPHHRHSSLSQKTNCFIQSHPTSHLLTDYPQSPVKNNSKTGNQLQFLPPSSMIKMKLKHAPTSNLASAPTTTILTSLKTRQIASIPHHLSQLYYFKHVAILLVIFFIFHINNVPHFYVSHLFIQLLKPISTAIA